MLFNFDTLNFKYIKEISACTIIFGSIELLWNILTLFAVRIWDFLLRTEIVP